MFELSSIVFQAEPVLLAEIVGEWVAILHHAPRRSCFGKEKSCIRYNDMIRDRSGDSRRGKWRPLRCKR